MATAYLSAYNVAQAAGWTAVLALTARAAAAGASVYGAAAPVVRT
jgi:hypothetical protein